MPVRDLLSAASGASAPADPYFYDVSLLLNGDGTNGAQNNTFLDSSTNNFTITRNGNTTQGSFSPYGNLWSNYFDGSSNLTVPSTSALSFGTGNFTIECWVNFSSVPNRAIGLIDGQATFTPSFYWDGGTYSTNKLVLSDRTVNQIQVSFIPTPGVWYHLAVVRSGTTYTIYANGVSLGSNTYVNTFSGTSYYTIGGDAGGGSNWNFPGYISNLRVTNSALYNSTFIPPIVPLSAISGTQLLTCQSNRFIDNSSNNFTLTVNGTPTVQRFSPFNPTAPYSTSVIGGSGYFDGSGDSLNAPNNSAFNLGTSDFTFEFWMYTGNVSTRQDILDRRATQTITGWMLSMSIVTAARLTFYASGPGWPLMTSNTNIAANTWNHIAIVRSGSSFKMYQNGVEVASATSSTSMSDNSYVVQIGNSIDNIYYSGYISNFLIVVGTAVYTANFTPPTAPVTAITNTQLLTNFTNAGIPDLAMQNNLETVGNAQVSTSVKKYGTGSLSFNGTTDALYSPYNSIYNFGSGDFTIEQWVYLNNTSTLSVPYVYKWGSGAANAAFELTIQSGGSTFYFFYGSSYLTVTNSATLSTGTWYHFAVVRNGTSLVLYINGVGGSSTNVSTNAINTATSSAVLTIAQNGVGGGDFVNGYIDDLRITKGLARYTTTFTPPTSALPTY